MKFPKDDKNYKWTSHIKAKMAYYRLSPYAVKTILRSPQRVEEGIAAGTTAAMRRNDKAKRQEELWLMYQRQAGRMAMISAWRYPGRSRPGKQIPIPDDIAEEVKNLRWS